MPEDPYRQFGEEGRRTLTYAQDEARRLDHTYIGTEHLLLGILRADSEGAEVLRTLGVDHFKVRSAVEFIIGRGSRHSGETVGLTERAKRVIELAVDEANRLGHGPVGSEHLLLACIREGEGIAAGVLQSLGVTLEVARAEVRRRHEVGAPAASADGAQRSASAVLMPTAADFGTSITPVLTVRGAAAAVEFYARAFGAVEIHRTTDPDGRIVAELSIGDARVRVAEEVPEAHNLSPETLGGTSVRLNLLVADPDAFVAHAIEAGAILVALVADQPYGLRQGRLADPFGHHWLIGAALPGPGGDWARPNRRPGQT